MDDGGGALGGLVGAHGGENTIGFLGAAGFGFGAADIFTAGGGP